MNINIHLSRILISFLPGLLLVACFASQTSIPERKFTLNDAEQPVKWDFKSELNDMVQVHTPTHSFHIDRFEVSELKKGDFFSIRNQLPLVNVNAAEAEEICKSAGKRLCSLYEWRHACLGVQKRVFSYSNKFKTDSCNVSGSGLKPTALSKNCSNDAAVFDMVGNAMEWVKDVRNDKFTAAGGSFATNENSNCFNVNYFHSTSKNNQTGFRCCR